MTDPQNGTGAASTMDRAKGLLNDLGTRLNETKARAAEKIAGTASATAAGIEAEAQSVEAEAHSVEETPALARAEETMDRLGERLGVFAANLSHRLRKAAALAREEAEDVLAEAQSLRGK